MPITFDSFNDEKWRPVVGFEGAYEVSTLGRVRSLPRTVVRRKRMAIYLDRASHIKRAHPMANRGKIMKCPPLYGYPRVNLRKEGKTFFKLVHRLIAEAFIGPCPEGEEVRHKNGNSLECTLNNIEYGTRKQNVADSIKHGAFIPSRRWAVLSEKEVLEIVQSSLTGAALAEQYGVKRASIQDIRMGRTWRSITEGLRKPSYRKRGPRPKG